MQYLQPACVIDLPVGLSIDPYTGASVLELRPVASFQPFWIGPEVSLYADTDLRYEIISIKDERPKYFIASQGLLGVSQNSNTHGHVIKFSVPDSRVRTLAHEIQGGVYSPRERDPLCNCDGNCALRAPS